MLELAGGIALGVDVADLLQLQRAFQGQGVHRAAAQVEHVAGPGDLHGQVADGVLDLQGFGDQPRRLQQHLHQMRLAAGVDAAPLGGGGDRQGGQDRHLGGEGLGRGHPDLGARVGGPQHVGLARHGGLVGVDDGGGGQPLVLAEPQGGQGVGGLARLGDGQRQGPWRQGGLAIAELRGYLHVDGQAGDPLEQVFADQAGVAGGAAGHDLDPLQRLEVDVPWRRGLHRHRIHIGAQGVLAAVGLFVDLLFHEVPVIALLDQGGRGGDHPDRAVHVMAGGVQDAGGGIVDGDDVAFLQIGHAIGEGTDGQGVRADEHLAIAMADHQRAAAPGAQHQPLLAFDQHRQGVGALQPRQGGLERGQGR